MVLVLNFFLQDDFAKSFDRVIQGHLSKAGQKGHFIRIRENTTAAEVLQQAGEATHLILSGSEASTLDDLGWEDEMKNVVETFMQQNKPILGICYGHQFLVRCLAGKAHLRKAPHPEMGWGNLSLKENPLFSGLQRPVCLLSHYDEAVNLPEDFTVLGSSDKCDIHAFQYKHLPVWGVQFHPEYDLEAGKEIFDDLKEKDPDFTHQFVDQLEEESRLEQNSQFFINFINSNR